MISVERPAAAVALAFSGELHGDVAQGVLALGDGVDRENFKGVLHGLNNLVNGLEGGVDGAVAQADGFKLFLAALERDRTCGGGEVGGMDGKPVQLVAALILLHAAGVAHQGLQIVIGDGLFLVAQILKPHEQRGQLLLAQLIAQPP